MLATIQTLLAMWPSVLGVFQTAGPYVLKYWKYILIALLVAANLFSYHEWQHTSASLKDEKAAHVADIKAVKKAQADAIAKAEAEKQTLIEESKVKADEADRSYSNLYTVYRTNLLRYQATQGGSSRPADSQRSPTPEGSNGPSPDTFVSISTDDANICAVNTARLQTAHDWAVNLQETINANEKDASSKGPKGQ